MSQERQHSPTNLPSPGCKPFSDVGVLRHRSRALRPVVGVQFTELTTLDSPRAKFNVCSSSGL